jgi:hypothetical protein
MTDFLFFVIGAAIGAMLINIFADSVDKERKYLIELLKEDLRKREGKR